MAGHFQKSIQSYQESIAKDPDYPPYYYNLACSFAEKGDLDSALVNLREAYKRRDKWPSDQTVSDPRQDSSFKKYLGNQDFEKAVKEFGF